MGKSSEVKQGSTKEKLKNFATRSKEELKKFSNRTAKELKKIGSSMASGYTLPMDKLIKYATFLTIGLGVLAYIIHTAPLAYLVPSIWGSNVWILIFPIIASVLYFLFVQKPLEANNFDDKTHIFLILSTGLACAALFWPGVPLFILFIEICVGSDAPFWRVLTESQAKPKIKPQTASGTKSQVKSVTIPQTKPRIKSQP